MIAATDALNQHVALRTRPHVLLLSQVCLVSLLLLASHLLFAIFARVWRLRAQDAHTFVALWAVELSDSRIWRKHVFAPFDWALLEQIRVLLHVNLGFIRMIFLLIIGSDHSTNIFHFCLFSAFWHCTQDWEVPRVNGHLHLFSSTRNMHRVSAVLHQNHARVFHEIAKAYCTRSAVSFPFKPFFFLLG